MNKKIINMWVRKQIFNRKRLEKESFQREKINRTVETIIKVY